MSRTLLPLLLLLALAAAGCGNGQCDAIARAYAAAIQQAQRCDPTAADPCGETRRASLGSGSNNCERVAIDPERKSDVDDLLAQFVSQQCPLGPSQSCPPLQPSDFECRPDGQGGGTCVRKGS